MKAVNTNVYFYVPSILDAARIPALAGYTDEAHWLLNRIVALHNTYRHGGDEYVSVSQETMATFIRRNDVAKVKNALIAARVIECDDHYLPTKYDPNGRGKSLGYKLAEPFWGPLRRVQCHKRSLAVKVLKYRLSLRDRPMEEHELDDVHAHLWHWLKRTKIDLSRAYQVIDETSEKAVSKKLGRRGRRKLVDAYGGQLEVVTRRKYICGQTCETIHHGEYDLHVCDYGRVHTPVTRLVTEARVCLSIADQPLVQLDIRNSQIVFFSLLLLDHYLFRPPHIDHSPSVTFSGRGEAHPDDSTDRDGVPDDVQEFIRLAMEGQLYDHMMLRTGETSRRRFKGRFFCEVFFGDPSKFYCRSSPLLKLFKEEFPNVYRYVLESKKGGYQKLAQRMQERESRYMYGQVCDRLCRHHPEVPLLTIHDSVMTTAPHEATVLRVMQEEFARLAIQPTIARQQ